LLDLTEESLLPESEYRLDWVTDTLAVGGAPLSYEQLDRIKEQGVDAIINLCAEYCDLHDIETNHGFEVYYLPIDDECTPDCESLEKAMEWMDGILGRNKRLLIHCRLGMGRTGTLLYSYLWSRNLHQAVDESLLQKIRSRPCNFTQWSTVRRYQGPACDWSANIPILQRLTGLWEKLFLRLKRLFEGG
jgi:protein tyrosine phosphatase